MIQALLQKTKQNNQQREIIIIAIPFCFKKGLTDLREGIVRTPLPAETTFLDDPLRILRYYSFDKPSTLHQFYVVAFHLCSNTNEQQIIIIIIICTFDLIVGQ